jgi:hypothetical protein
MITQGMYVSSSGSMVAYCVSSRFKAKRETKTACQKRGLPLGLLSLLEELTDVQPSKRPSIQKVVQKSASIYVRPFLNPAKTSANVHSDDSHKPRQRCQPFPTLEH